MSSIETLVAAMNQKDASLYQAMNLRTDAIIVNQAGGWDCCDYRFERGQCTLVITPERGVGRNRNHAKTVIDITAVNDDPEQTRLYLAGVGLNEQDLIRPLGEWL
ncbi:MAG: hypothetical protein ABRQ26_05380 [Syntrophomonadaceae bacterium]